MRIEVELTPEDHVAFSRFVLRGDGGFRRFMPGGSLRFVGALAVGGLIFGITLSFVSRSAAQSFNTPTVLVSVFVTAFLVLLSLRFLEARNATERVAPRGLYTYTISPEGIHEQSANTESLMRWSGVRTIHDAPAHIFVLGPGVGAILPKRCLGTPSPEMVLSALQEHWRAASGS
jgi:hypothetical protein